MARERNGVGGEGDERKEQVWNQYFHQLQLFI